MGISYLKNIYIYIYIYFFILQKGALCIRAFSNLNMEVCKLLEPVLSNVFLFCSSKEEVCDNISNKWRVYQMVSFSEYYYKCSEKLVSTGRHQASYWRKAFQLAGVLVVVKSDCSFNFDTLINSF